MEGRDQVRECDALPGRTHLADSAPEVLAGRGGLVRPDPDRFEPTGAEKIKSQVVGGPLDENDRALVANPGAQQIQRMRGTGGHQDVFRAAVDPLGSCTPPGESQPGRRRPRVGSIAESGGAVFGHPGLEGRPEEGHGQQRGIGLTRPEVDDRGVAAHLRYARSRDRRVVAGDHHVCPPGSGGRPRDRRPASAARPAVPRVVNRMH